MNKYILTIYSLSSWPIFCFEAEKIINEIRDELKARNVSAKRECLVAFSFYGHSISPSDHFAFEVETLEDFFSSRLAKS